MAFVCENARVLRAFFDRPPTRGREQTKCSYEIFRALPKGARALATTEAIPCQAFDLPGKPVLALQFHLEVPASAIEDWLIGHHGQLQREGIDTCALRAETQRWAPAAECAARKVFGDWLRAAS